MSERDGRSAAGRLLVAAPVLDDPHFARTVVLVLEHTVHGALGVVLNRPQQTDLGDVLPGWSDVAAAPSLLFAGGPVQPEVAVAVARTSVAPAGAEIEGFRHLDAPHGRNSLGTVDLDTDPRLLAAAGVRDLRVFAGYAGWGEGQLDGEIAAGGWYVIDALPGDVATPRPDALWRAVLRRQGGELALVSTFPADPTLN